MSAGGALLPYVGGAAPGAPGGQVTAAGGAFAPALVAPRAADEGVTHPMTTTPLALAATAVAGAEAAVAAAHAAKAAAALGVFSARRS